LHAAINRLKEETVTVAADAAEQLKRAAKAVRDLADAAVPDRSEGSGATVTATATETARQAKRGAVDSARDAEHAMEEALDLADSATKHTRKSLAP
jgi:dihydroxyacetone kinase-like predicted kinase